MNFPFLKNRPLDVVGIGRNSWDRIALVERYPEANQKIEIAELDNQAGGQVATTMVACSKLGAKTRYLGKFGDDAAGRAVRAALVHAGVDLSESKVVPGVSNQNAFIVVDQKHQTRNVFSFTDPRLKLDPDDFALEIVTSGKILYLGGRGPRDMVPFAKMGNESGCCVAIDADTVSDEVSELLKLSHIVFCPEEFPREFSQEKSTEKAMQAISRLGPKVICQTRGSQGATILSEGQFFEWKGFSVEVKDTTGAGDVFQGAFLVALLGNRLVSECVPFAGAAAALKCQSLGGQKGIPTLREIEAFLSKQS